MQRTKSVFVLPFLGVGVLLNTGLAAPAGAAEERPVLAAADDPQVVADAIDGLVSERWAEAGVVPAEPADDAEFLRRVSLHIGGCIPDVATARVFLASATSDKRRQYVEELLDGPGYVVNFMRFWRSVMLPDNDADIRAQFMGLSFEAWLRQELSRNTPYDGLVRSVISADASGSATGPQGRPSASGSLTPVAFFQSRKGAPENIAAATARVFLGVRIECAQCHDHPFDPWKRDQFWSLAAFYGGFVRNENENDFSIREVPGRSEITIPDSSRVVQAAYLDGSVPQWKPGTGPRAVLAQWVTSRENPYFARAAVNRLWGHFFGIGLVQPVDDFTERNPSSHPKLLDRLAEEFVRHDFDLKFIIRAITLSKTYQLSSRRPQFAPADAQLFARMPVQGLTAAQVADSLLQASGQSRQLQGTNRNVRVRGSEPAELDESFGGDAKSKAEHETTVLQALALMNGQFVGRATTLGQSGRTLAAVADAPFLDTEGKIETLFLAALTRPEEMLRVKSYFETGGPAKDANRALEDLFWALLNTSEFLLNH